MPSVEQIRQFLVGQVLPLVVGIATTWLTIHVHLLATFHIGAGTVASDLTQLGVWGVSAGLTWLGIHHILSGNYSPEAKAWLPVGTQPLKPLSYTFETGGGKAHTGTVERAVDADPQA